MVLMTESDCVFSGSGFQLIMSQADKMKVSVPASCNCTQHIYGERYSQAVCLESALHHHFIFIMKNNVIMFMWKRPYFHLRHEAA